MPIMEISIVPLGTGSSSLSPYIAEIVKVVSGTKGIKYELTAMGTIIEATSIDALFDIAKKMHQVALKKGSGRVLTSIKIDDRIDKELTIKGKIEAVKTKI